MFLPQGYNTVNQSDKPPFTEMYGMVGVGRHKQAGGAKGKRYTLPNSEFLLDQPYSGTKGQASNIKIEADHVMRTRATVNGLMAKHTGQPLEAVEAATERQHFLTAEEAIEFGIVDKILTNKA